MDLTSRLRALVRRPNGSITVKQNRATGNRNLIRGQFLPRIPLITTRDQVVWSPVRPGVFVTRNLVGPGRCAISLRLAFVRTVQF